MCCHEYIPRTYYIPAHEQSAAREYPSALISSAGTPTLTSGAWTTSGKPTWSTIFSNLPYGNGIHKVTASGGYEWSGAMYYPQWSVFDSVSQSIGASWKDQNYNLGAFVGDSISLYTLDNGYYGDWVYIQLPEPIVVTGCSFTIRAGYSHRAPSKFR
jgi:hypothetical protein